MTRQLILNHIHLLLLTFQDSQLVLLHLDVLYLFDLLLLKLVNDLLLQILLGHYYVLEILVYGPAVCHRQLGHRPLRLVEALVTGILADVELVLEHVLDLVLILSELAHYLSAGETTYPLVGQCALYSGGRNI